MTDGNGDPTPFDVLKGLYLKWADLDPTARQKAVDMLHLEIDKAKRNIIDNVIPKK